MRSQTINISLPAALLGQLDKARQKSFASRSRFIQDAVISMLEAARFREEDEDWQSLLAGADELAEIASQRGYTTDEDFVRLVKEVRAERRAQRPTTTS